MSVNLQELNGGFAACSCRHSVQYVSAEGYTMSLARCKDCYKYSTVLLDNFLKQV